MVTQPKKKTSFRVVKGAGKRVVNPRTGKDDGKSPVESPGRYYETLGKPDYYAELLYLDPWYAAAMDAIADNVGAVELKVAYENEAEPDKKEDPKIAQAMKTFLDMDDRDYTTPEERLEALALDYRGEGFCAFEVGRDSKRIPIAWYQVPAATLRKRKRDGIWEQFDALGKTIQEFGPYIKGGREDDLPELMVIKKYDPRARYLGRPAGAALLGTIERLAAQDDFNTQLLRRGGIPPWLLFLKEEMGDESFKRLEEYFRELEAGNASDLIGILDGVGEGAELKKLVEDLADMAHQEGEKAMRERILACLHVPPTKVSLSASNYATAYQEDQTFKFGVIQPLIRRLLKRITAVATEISQDPNYYYTFRQQTLEDYLQLVQAEDLLQSKGVHTINDVLARLGQSGIGPEGDVRVAWTGQGPVLLEDLMTGKLPMTPGRMMDALFELRRMIEEAKRVPASTPVKTAPKE